MNIVRPVLVVLACAAFAAPAGAANAVVYGAPALTAPAGHVRGETYRAILPSGRIVSPAGTNTVVGMNALGMTLTPDGRFAIISNDDEREAAVQSAVDPLTFGGFSLVVVDTQTMRVVDRYRSPKESYYAGIVALPDPVAPNRTLVFVAGGPANALFAFTLDASGALRPDAKHAIAIPGPTDALFADSGHSFPAQLVLAPNGGHLYVINELGENVSVIDTATRALLPGTKSVGYFPAGAAIAANKLVVANEGLMRYAFLPTPARLPPYATTPPDLARASSLSVLAIGGDGTLSQSVQDAPPFGNAPIPMDPAPDGDRVVGGAHPTAIVATPNGRFAFVAMTNVDRIAAVSLADGKVVGGTELRLFDRAPYGTQPFALALSRDGSRLYVALAGLNAVAVIDARDPIHLHRLGLIPTGWYPTALALGEGDRTLYTVAAKGFGHDAGFVGDFTTFADSNAVWSTLQKIDLRGIKLAETTRNTLRFVRSVAPAKANPIVPQTIAMGPSKAIKHVVVILQENKTYDAMLGDLADAQGRPYGPGDPKYVSFGANVTPNLHELARTFALAGNTFADAEESDAGHQFFAGGIATAYTEKTLLVKNGRRPLANKNEDPEDYPRAGYIFNNLARHGITFRDYGDFVRVSGFDEGHANNPRVDDPNFAGIADGQAPTSGLGGLFALDVPAPLVLAGHVDENYPGWNLRVRDERRAREFIRDFDTLAKANAIPKYIYIWLPADHGGSGADIPPLPEEVADGDRALGMIVDHLTHAPTWRDTAIFVTPDDAQSSRDHIEEYRTYAVVISPYARHHYISMHHTSTVSILKTTEELLGVPALALGDLLASDLADFFTTTPSFAPFTMLPVATQTASAEGVRIAALLAQTDQSGPDADSARAARLIDLSRQADALALRRFSLPGGRYAALQDHLYAEALAQIAVGSGD